MFVYPVCVCVVTVRASGVLLYDTRLIAWYWFRFRKAFNIWGNPSLHDHIQELMFVYPRPLVGEPPAGFLKTFLKSENRKSEDERHEGFHFTYTTF